MAPRNYDNSLRKEMEADTIRRIVTATVELHAEKGALATTHAEIADAAGVSVATVYKHFPSRESLLPHCTGMVAEQAPRIDVQAILGTHDRKNAIGRLVRALHERYRYMHPWMRWSPRDAAALPALGQIVAEGRRQTEGLVRAVLDSVAAPITDEIFALAMVILDYPAWQRLNQMLNDPERVSSAAEQALQLLLSSTPQANGRK
jgi:AcrR family transcriptional regulator